MVYHVQCEWEFQYRWDIFIIDYLEAANLYGIFSVFHLVIKDFEITPWYETSDVLFSFKFNVLF